MNPERTPIDPNAVVKDLPFVPEPPAFADTDALTERIRALEGAPDDVVTPEERGAVLRGKLAAAGFLKRTIDLVVESRPLPRPEVKEPYAKMCDALAAFILDGKMVALLGPNGRGKTAIAGIVVKRCLEAGRAAHFTTLYDLGLRLEEAQSERGSESRRGIKAQLGNVAALVIDEIGKGFDTPAQAKFLTDLLNVRYGNERGTLLIGNLGAATWTRASADKEFKELLGPSVFDRMREAGGVVYADWGSLRLVNGEK